MGDKADYQHSQENGVSKTFTETAISSPEFGVAQRDREVARGTVPGKAQWEPLSPDPETP